MATLVSCPRCEAQGGANRVEVAEDLGVGAEQGGFGIGQAVAQAVLPDQGLGVAQVGPGHRGGQVVLDLVVEATEEGVTEPAAAAVAGGQDLATEEVELVGLAGDA